MKIDPTLHRAKKAIVQVLFDLSQKRERKKEAANEKRKAEQRQKEEMEFQRQRAEVEIPDTPEALQIWMEVMGQRTSDSISEIRAKHYTGFIGSSYTMSFCYRSESDLIEILGQTYWSELYRALNAEEEEYTPSSYLQQKPIPRWHGFWPVQPGKGSLEGGFPSSRPFVSDCYFFFLDIVNKRVFLSTGMTHAQYRAEIDGLLARNSVGKQAS